MIKLDRNYSQFCTKCRDLHLSLSQMSCGTC